MSYFLNEHSLEGQYVTSHDFRQALAVIAHARNRVREAEYDFYCCPEMLAFSVGSGVTFQAMVNDLGRDMKRLVMGWFSAQPTWSEMPCHNAVHDEYLCNGRNVNGSSLAEGACTRKRGLLSEMLSFAPSDAYNASPICVTWETPADGPVPVDVDNRWTLEQVTESLNVRQMEAETRPVTNWRELIEWGRAYCPQLFLADYLIASLQGVPFSLPVARQVQQRLKTLDALKAETRDDGSRTATGQEIYSREFVGNRAHFTDESDTNKRAFQRDLTFPHPEQPGETLFCPWHGKVSTQLFRIHFTWPLESTSPLYVVYIGRKITTE